MDMKTTSAVVQGSLALLPFAGLAIVQNVFVKNIFKFQSVVKCKSITILCSS